MELELRFFATFREAVGQKTLVREYDTSELTVREVLQELEAEYNDLAGAILEDGEIRDMLTVLKNGQGVAHGAGADTVLEDGDTLAVFPPVAGG